MSKERVIEFLKEKGLFDGYIEMDESTSTVPLAAKALGVEEGRIAKTMSFSIKDSVILILARGDKRIDNKKYKKEFSVKARFLSQDKVPELTGYPVGGVCPFAVKEGISIYLDISLKDFDHVYPAAGSPNNAVKITIPDLEWVTGGRWVDVCED
jgi:prolyl-tRNA editing enzyme YbaK/EbsC (Cys-tRNA(Pro) deacylase)